MKTESHPISYVLTQNNTSFFIPPFQRAYAWGKTEIERYFDDICKLIKSEMSESHDKQEHFFGTLVIKEEKAGFAHKSIIIDGQQRLTTTLIFLIALRDLERDSEKKSFITNNYLTNNASSFQDKIKLKQVTNDWKAYRALVNNTVTESNGIIYNAYILFKKLIEDEQKINPIITIDHYITAIQRMNVAVIFLDERPHKGEDPQIIFETLNSLGKPLTLSDLIRNYVLLNMNTEEQTEIYEKIWFPQIESILKDNCSNFFRDYLQYKKAIPIKVVSDSNTKEIYHIFKNYVEHEFSEHKEFINDIIPFVTWYKWILAENITDSITNDLNSNKYIAELLKNIFHDIGSESFKPLVLGLLKCHQTEKELYKDYLFIEDLEIIRTYLIRRRILGLTQAENKNIVLLCSRIKEVIQRNIELTDLLTSMFYKLRLPNDFEIKDRLQSIKFYEDYKKYSKFILGKIEEFKTKVSVDFRNPKITIEHIMPQKLSSTWKNDLGNDFNIIHEKYLHNIGNLILTEFNSEMGNKSFSEKKEKLEKSSLSYRLSVINKSIWNEESIQEHQNNMINWFLLTFSLPEGKKVAQNWNTKDSEIATFSPMDEEAADFIVGKKPLAIKIEDKTNSVKTWQDVIICFIKYLKTKYSTSFEEILVNKNYLNSKRDAIITWKRLKSIIKEERDLKERYKNFEGKLCTEVKRINDDEIFIHTNISATECIRRINIFMDKFNILNENIEITLK